MENAGFLFAAFAIMWALVFFLVLRLMGQQRKLRRELDALTGNPEEKEQV
ncbi:MAG: CcmD family protein [Chloroflexota bacterium]